MSTLSPAVALSSSLNFPVLLSLATISAQIQLWQVFCRYLQAKPPIRFIDGRKFICLGGTQENDHGHGRARRRIALLARSRAGTASGTSRTNSLRGLIRDDFKLADDAF